MKVFPLSLFFFFCFWAMYAQVPMPFSDGYRLVDDDGENFVDDVYDYIDFRSSQYYLAVKNGQFGYLNTIGKMAIPFKYDVAYPFDGDFALVGKDGRYIHINASGEELETLEQPYAPMVLYRSFLVSNGKNGAAIIDNEGNKIFQSEFQLWGGSDTRFIEFDKEGRRLKIYMINRSSKEVHELESLENVLAARMNVDGVPVLKQELDGKTMLKVFPVTSSEPFEIEDVPFHLPGVRIMDYMIYLPKEGSQYDHAYDNQTGRLLFDSDDIWLSHYNRKLNAGLMIPHDFTDHYLAQIKGFNKWVLYNGSELKGNDMFDEVSASAENQKNIMVRQEDTWFAFDGRELKPIPFKNVLRAPMWSNVVFGSENYSNDKWAMYNLVTGDRSEEVFDIPSNNMRLSSNPMYPPTFADNFNWLNKDLAILNVGGKGTLVNQKCEILRESDVKYAPRNDFSEFKRIKLNGLLEKAGSADDFSGKIKRSFSKKQLSLYLQNKTGGLTVYLVNNTKSKLQIEVQDGVPDMTLEYEKSPGVWEIMSRMEDTFCGNSFYMTELPAGECQKSSLNYAKGNKSLNVRFSLYPMNGGEVIHSNVVSISVNPGIMWVEEYHAPFGLERFPRF